MLCIEYIAAFLLTLSLDSKSIDASEMKEDGKLCLAGVPSGL